MDNLKSAVAPCEIKLFPPQYVPLTLTFSQPLS